MTEVRISRPEDIPAQKALWKEAFGDGDRDIALFYDVCWRPEEMLLLLEDGKLASMTALLPHTLALPDGEAAKAYYVYALATAKARRGAGLARTLLAHADGLLRERGADCVTVVPAEDSLHHFFASAGFQPCFDTWRMEMRRSDLPSTPAGSRLEECSPAEYGALRRSLLEDRPAVHYPERLLDFQAGMCRLARGGLFRLTVNGESGCAAAEYRGPERLVVKELLLPWDRLAEGAALLLEALPAQVCEVRTTLGLRDLPCGAKWSFGRIKWFDPEQEARFGPVGYMGLGFD